MHLFHMMTRLCMQSRYHSQNYDRLFYLNHLIRVEEQEASVKCHGLLLCFSQFVLKSICSCCFNFLL